MFSLLLICVKFLMILNNIFQNCFTFLSSILKELLPLLPLSHWIKTASLVCFTLHYIHTFKCQKVGNIKYACIICRVGGGNGAPTSYGMRCDAWLHNVRTGNTCRLISQFNSLRCCLWLPRTWRRCWKCQWARNMERQRERGSEGCRVIKGLVSSSLGLLKSVSRSETLRLCGGICVTHAEF